MTNQQNKNIQPAKFDKTTCISCLSVIVCAAITFYLFMQHKDENTDTFGVLFVSLAIAYVAITIINVIRVKFFHRKRITNANTQSPASTPADVVSNSATATTKPTATRVMTYTTTKYGITEDYFNEFTCAARQLKAFYRKLKSDSVFMEEVNRCQMDFEDKLFLLFVCDIAKNYEKLGHDSSMLDTREGIAFVYLFGLISTYSIDISNSLIILPMS